MKLSLLITAWNEARTIGKCITSLIGDYKGEVQIVLGCPDDATLQAAQKALKDYDIDFVHVRDEQKGKPAALNLMMQHAAGDIWIFGDGDVYYGKNTIQRLLNAFKDPSIHAVTGRPVSADKKDSMMGYWGHLLADAAHHKRSSDLGNNPQKKKPFFPVSGYLFGIRARKIVLPEDTLVEDAYISYLVHESGGKIAYAPTAKVFVKYAATLSDYFKQKKRSVGGYVQLWKYGFVTKQNNTRSLWQELTYAWFPLKYASNLRQLWWSILLYPTRLWLWLRIFWERKIKRKHHLETWTRVESTK